jgi:MFS family permease
MAVTTLLTTPYKMYRIAVSYFFFSAGICFASWASRIPNIQQKLNLNEAGLGTMLLALPIGLVVSLPFAGYFVARFGSRLIVTIAAILYACILPIIGLVTAPLQLAIALFAFGFCGNMLNISVNTQGVSVEAFYGRSIMASFHGVWSLAGFTGAGIGAIMVANVIPPFIHFVGISVVLILGALYVNRFLVKEDIGSESDQPIFAKPDRALLLLGLIAFCCMLSEGTMFDWSGVYFKKVVQVKPSLTLVGYTAFMSTMAAGRFAGDWLSTKFGKKQMIQLSGLIIATGLMTSVLFPYIVTATLGFLLVGIGVSSVVPLVYGAAGKSSTMSAGVAIAAASTIGYIGFLFGPPTIGFIAQISNLRWSFTLIAFLGLCTTFLASKSSIK